MLNDKELKLLPVSIVGGDISDLPVLAAETWIHGPTKPRHLLRTKEIPERDVSIEKLPARLAYLDILPHVEVRASFPEDVKGASFSEADVLVINGLRSVFSGKELFVMKELAGLGKPIVAGWDNWGIAWEGFMLREYLAPFDSQPLIPFDADEVESILRSLAGWKALRRLRALYIGDIPSHSVLANFDLIDIHRRLGPVLEHRTIEEYLRTVDDIPDSQAQSIANAWQAQYSMMDKREVHLPKLAKVYLALKEMLHTHAANGLTVDCAFLPDVDLAPCFAFSLLIDEGIPCGCEGDTNALMMMATLMGISNGPALMGNLFENATHGDIEDDVITINHDVVPPSMGCSQCSLCLRDFHESGKGLTDFVELKEGSTVTIGGMNTYSSAIWATTGEVAWTKDTAHCRTSIGIHVRDAKEIGSGAFGHHQVMTYGDYIGELEVVANIMGLEFRRL